MSVHPGLRHWLAIAKLRTVGWLLILTVSLSCVFWFANMTLYVALAFHYPDPEAAKTAEQQAIWLLGGALASLMVSLWAIWALWRHMRRKVIESDRLPKHARPGLHALLGTILVVAMCLAGAYAIAIGLQYLLPMLFVP